MICSTVSTAYSCHRIAGRPPNLRRHLLVVGSRRFGEEQLAPANREPGQDRDEQRNHAHAAEPGRQRPPEKHASTELREITEHGRARRRQPRHRFERRIDRTEARPHVGDPGEAGDQQPRGRHDREAFGAPHAFERLFGRNASGLPHQVPDPNVTTAAR